MILGFKPQCVRPKPTLSHGLLVFFKLIYLFSFTITVSLFYPPPMPCSSSFLFSNNPNLPPLPPCVLYSMSACPSVTVCLPVSLCLSSCLLSCCLSFLLPRVLSLVPVFPILSVCLSLSQLFHLFHYFSLCHLHYFASCSLTFSASQQAF